MHVIFTLVLQNTTVADCRCCLGVRIDDESGSGSMIGCQNTDGVSAGFYVGVTDGRDAITH